MSIYCALLCGGCPAMGLISILSLYQSSLEKLHAVTAHWFPNLSGWTQQKFASPSLCISTGRWLFPCFVDFSIWSSGPKGPVLLWEPNTWWSGVVMSAPGRGCTYRWSFILSPLLTSCHAAWGWWTPALEHEAASSRSWGRERREYHAGASCCFSSGMTLLTAHWSEQATWRSRRGGEGMEYTGRNENIRWLFLSLPHLCFYFCKGNFWQLHNLLVGKCIAVALSWWKPS